MAEYKNVSDRYHNYDHLADVDTIQQAVKLYENHLAAARLLAVVEMFHLGLVKKWGRRDQSSLRDSDDSRFGEEGRSRRTG